MIYSPGWKLIKAERQRQIEKKGYDAAHDADESPEGLCQAALAYRECHGPEEHPSPMFWPWDEKWWKPKDRLRNLVRAGALYLAASDRADASGMHVKAKGYRDQAVLCNHRIENEHLIPA